MAGMPKRRQRRQAGLPPGVAYGAALTPDRKGPSRPPEAAPTDSERRAHAYAHARDLVVGLPSDAVLFATAKAILLELAQYAEQDKDRVSAARAIVEATRPRDGKGDGDDLNHLPSEQLMAQVEAAKRALGESPPDGQATQ